MTHQEKVVIVAVHITSLMLGCGVYIMENRNPVTYISAVQQHKTN